MTWVLVGALGVFIAQDFGLTAAEKGLMVAVPVLSGALGRIGVGACTDRYGPRRTGLANLVLTIVPLLWGWTAVSSFSQVLVLGLLLGIAGTSFAVALPLAGRAYPSVHQGLALGLAGSGNSGSILSLAMAPLLAERIGWHQVFGAMIPLVLLTVVAFGTLARDLEAETASMGMQRSWPNLLRDPLVQRLGLLYGMTFGGFVGLTSYFSIFFYDQYSLSPVDAGWAAAACALAGSVARPVGGYVADHYGTRGILVVLYPCILLLTGITALLLPFAFTFAASLLLITSLGFGNGVIFHEVGQRCRIDIGTVTGLVGAAGGLAGFLLPFALGLFRDVTGTYATGFGFFAALVTGVVVLVERRHV